MSCATTLNPSVSAVQKKKRRSVSFLVTILPALNTERRGLTNAPVARSTSSRFMGLRKVFHQFQAVLAVAVVVFEFVHICTNQRPTLTAYFKLFDRIRFVVVGVDC